MKRQLFFVVVLCLVSTSLLAAPRKARRVPKKAAPSKASTGALTPEQKADAQAALIELRKLRTATKVGLKFDDYNSRLIDASAAIEQHVEALPSGLVKSGINQSLQAFQDAQTVWNASRETEYISIYLSKVNQIFYRYGVSKALKSGGVPYPPKDGSASFYDESHQNEYRTCYVTLPLSIIWVAAGAKLESASKDLAAGKR